MQAFLRLLVVGWDLCTDLQLAGLVGKAALPR